MTILLGFLIILPTDCHINLTWSSYDSKHISYAFTLSLEIDSTSISLYTPVIRWKIYMKILLGFLILIPGDCHINLTWLSYDSVYISAFTLFVKIHIFISPDVHKKDSNAKNVSVNYFLRWCACMIFLTCAIITLFNLKYWLILSFYKRNMCYYMRKQLVKFLNSASALSMLPYQMSPRLNFGIWKQKTLLNEHLINNLLRSTTDSSCINGLLFFSRIILYFYVHHLEMSLQKILLNSNAS